MNRMIGVIHLSRNLKRLMRYIDSDYGTPRSLMLEIPPDWEDRYKKGCPDGYFYDIAVEFKNRGSRIIAGDRNRHIIEPASTQRMIDTYGRFKGNEWNPQTFSEWVKGAYDTLIGGMVIYPLTCAKNALIPSKHRIRNQGFLEAYDETNPELTIIGAGHGRFLKHSRPEIEYIMVISGDFIERHVAFPINYCFTGLARGADSYVVLPSSSV